jgi:cathepsin B
MKLHLFLLLQLLAISFSMMVPSHSLKDNSLNFKLKILPQSLDLREIYSSCNFNIYEEGICTGSWAIAVADTVSDLLCIQNNTNVALSPQHLVDCSQHTNVCKNSTNTTLLIDTLNKVAADGLTTSACYPYTAEFTGNTGACASQCADKTPISQLYKINTITNLTSTDDIKSFILQYGSVVATMKFYGDFRLYSKGQYNANTNSNYLGYHSVKIIGWGVDGSNQDYWIVANSWGISWGLNGYFYLPVNNQVLVEALGVHIA